jgi:hypothetical protein
LDLLKNESFKKNPDLAPLAPILAALSGEKELATKLWEEIYERHMKDKEAYPPLQSALMGIGAHLCGRPDYAETVARRIEGAGLKDSTGLYREKKETAAYTTMTNAAIGILFALLGGVELGV